MTTRRKTRDKASYRESPHHQHETHPSPFQYQYPLDHQLHRIVVSSRVVRHHLLLHDLGQIQMMNEVVLGGDLY